MGCSHLLQPYALALGPYFPCFLLYRRERRCSFYGVSSFSCAPNPNTSFSLCDLKGGFPLFYNHTFSLSLSAGFLLISMCTYVKIPLIFKNSSQIHILIQLPLLTNSRNKVLLLVSITHSFIVSDLISVALKPCRLLGSS